MASEQVPAGEKEINGEIDSAAVSLVVQLRIYDVLMAIYRELDKDKADRLFAVHEQGRVLGSQPWLNMWQEG